MPVEEDREQIVIGTDEVRGGTTPHVMRYVLVISMALAILGMGLLWWIGSL